MLCTGPALAQEVWDFPDPFELSAVGRLNVDGAGFCSGALIAPDQVLTAAHCLYDPVDGELVSAQRVHFFAGRRGNRSSAFRNASAIFVHPDYQFKGGSKLDRVAADLAVIELDRPVLGRTAEPFELGQTIAIGSPVSVTAYADTHAEHVDVQEACLVLQQQPSVYLLSCHVTNGASGAPVFALQDGVQKIVAVISAKAQWRDQPVALTTNITDALSALFDEMSRP